MAHLTLRADSNVLMHEFVCRKVIDEVLSVDAFIIAKVVISFSQSVSTTSLTLKNVSEVHFNGFLDPYKAIYK